MAEGSIGNGMALNDAANVDVRQLEMAVRCAFECASASLKDLQARQMKQQAEAFILGVKNSPQGWRLQLELFESSSEPQIKFFALQSIQEALTKSQKQMHQPQPPSATSATLPWLLTADATLQIRTHLLNWLQANVGVLDTSAAFLKNKLAVVLTLLIKADYPDRWPTAFRELMQLLPLGPSMVELFFRLLVAINEEIAEFDAQRTQKEAAANMRIKDAMRESSCMAETFDAIYNVLINFELNDVMQQLSLSALDTLKHYISWVDIALIVNDRYMPLLVKLLRCEESGLRCAAANCLFEVIDKGMDASKKLALIQEIKVLELLPTLSAIKEDEEFAEEIGEVINCVGLQLVECMDAFRHEQNVELFRVASVLLAQLMPLVWDLFACDNKDVSEEVFEIVNAVGTLLRTESSSAGTPGFEEVFKPSEYIPQILHGIYRQTRYPGEQMDYDDAEFEEYRRSLYKIYVNITRMRPLETLGFLTSLAQQLPQQFVEVNPRDLESFVALVYRFKEGIVTVKEVQSLEEPNSPFVSMIAELHARMIQAAAAAAASSQFLNANLLLTYYELAVRYSKVLQNNSSMIPAVLEMMFGPSGLNHSNATVRSRACYMCLRLVKVIGSSVHPHVSSILQALQPNLNFVSENDSVMNGKSLIAFEDRLYLFELAGQVIASLSSTGPAEVLELKYKYAAAVLEPLLAGINLAVMQLRNGKWSAEFVGEQSARVLTATAHFLKSFRGTSCMANQQELFSEVRKASSCVLVLLPNNALVRSKVIFTFHRLITVLDAEHLLCDLSNTLEPLMVCCDGQDVVEVVQLLNQLIIKFNSALTGFFDVAMMPFIQHLCALMPARNPNWATVEVKDSQQLEREGIQKYLYTFLLHIMMHQLDPVLWSDRNAGQLEDVLRLVLEGCADVQEPLINRTCFTIAHEMVSKWFLDATKRAQVPAPITALVSDYLMNQFTPAMFVLAKHKSFSVQDVQCLTVAKEVATLQHVLFHAMGDRFLSLVRDGIFPSLAVPMDLIAAYDATLRSDNRKLILDFYKSFAASQ